MNSQRTTMNWASAALSIIFVVIYLFAPFYTATLIGFVDVTSSSGLNLIASNPVAILPVILGILMAVAACCFPPLASFIIEALGTIVTSVFMFLGNTLSNTSIIYNTNASITDNVVNNISFLGARFQPGWGAVFCVGLCIAALIVDILANRGAKAKHDTYVPSFGPQFGNSTANPNELFGSSNSSFGNNDSNLF